MIIGKLDLKKIGARLRITDRFLLHVLKTRVSHGGLSGCVAESKRKGTKDGIFTTRRQDVEDHRIELAKKWAGQDGLDPNFAASLQHQVMSESSKVQNEIMIAEYQRQEAIINENDPDAVYAYQRSNLLRLTKKNSSELRQKLWGRFFWIEKLFRF